MSLNRRLREGSFCRSSRYLPSIRRRWRGTRACRPEGLKPAAIAGALGRLRSTISRELRRNGGAAGGCDALETQRLKAGRRKQAPGTALWKPVVMGLLRGHSPEQVAGRAKREHPGDRSKRPSHETIYLALYALPRGELRRELLAGLRQGRAARRPRGRGKDRRGSLPAMASIRERPGDVEGRLVPGH